MTDELLDLNANPKDKKTESVEAAPAVVSDLVLEPPAAVPVLGAAQASSLMPLNDGRSDEITDRAKNFVAGLAQLDPKAPEFSKKVSDVTAMGRNEIKAAAAVSNRMLDRPVKALEAAGGKGAEGDPQRQVAKTLVDLRLVIEDLDPSRQEGGLLNAILDILPFRDKFRSYFAKYSSSQKQIDAIIRSLESGGDNLRKDNAAIEGEKARLWAIMNTLKEYAVLTAALDSEIEDHVALVRVQDAERADLLVSDLLFAVRQKHQDLLTQLAVSAQGYLALDVIRKNNLELIKGVDRATTTTISALRTAVIVAQALANQKLVLDQINALNSTTSNLIVATSQMLKSLSQEIAEQSSSATVNIESLQAAFQNIYDTIDAIDTYKVKAVETMGQTVNALQERLTEASAYLERAQQQDGN